VCPEFIQVASVLMTSSQFIPGAYQIYIQMIERQLFELDFSAAVKE